MAIDNDLATDLRAALAESGAVREVKMFGGIAFMLNGNMLVAASGRGGLLVRIGKDRQHEALARPGVRPMEMRGRVMESYVYIDPPVGNDAVQTLLPLALHFVQALPPKASVSKPTPKKKGKRK